MIKFEYSLVTKYILMTGFKNSLCFPLITVIQLISFTHTMEQASHLICFQTG